MTSDLLLGPFFYSCSQVSPQVGHWYQVLSGHGWLVAGQYESPYLRGTPRGAQCKPVCWLLLDRSFCPWGTQISKSSAFMQHQCWHRQYLKCHLLFILIFAYDGTGKSSGWSAHGGRSVGNQTSSLLNLVGWLVEFVFFTEKSSWRPGSLLKKDWQQRGPHWHCRQAHFLLKFYSSVTNISQSA